MEHVLHVIEHRLRPCFPVEARVVQADADRMVFEAPDGTGSVAVHYEPLWTDLLVAADDGERERIAINMALAVGAALAARPASGAGHIPFVIQLDDHCLDL